MSIDNTFFRDNMQYLKAYLEWLDNRIQSLYECKTNDKDNSPLKGLVISNMDIHNIIYNTNSFYDTDSYNILEDERIQSLQDKIEHTMDIGIVLNLEKLCLLFNLNMAEKIFILISVAVEIDEKYGKIFAYFNDNINKVRPTVAFAMRVLGVNDATDKMLRESFFEDSNFRKYILHYSFGSQDTPLNLKELRVDERIVNYVLDINELDNDIKNSITVINLDDIETVIEDNNKYDEICAFKENSNNETSFICIYGENGIGKKEVVKQFCKNQYTTGLIVNLKLMINNAEDFKINMHKVIRETLLNESILIFENYADIKSIEDNKQRNSIENTFLSELEVYHSLVFILSENKLNLSNLKNNKVISMEIEKPDYSTRVKLWHHYLDKYDVQCDNIEDCATKFNFTPLQIKNTVVSYKTKVDMIKEDSEDIDKLIYKSCFEQVNSNLYKRATKVNLSYSWEQLILPDEQKELLMDACNQVENKYKVYDEWGFDKTVAYGKGVQIVCAGPPGTGKTMSAQVIANKLNLELFKIDLSQIVSKYVGETEKNLNEIFTEAKISNAILFFDEADALFGKRSEVRNSNDRYSNLETSYLLQKIEEYEGVSMLATNYLKNIDDAFMRRMKYIISFPFPDAKTRKKIWEITIPKDAPVSRDIDYDFLSETFEVSGGNIKNILVYAAFMAAAEKSKINMKYILKATQYEMQKLGKLILGQELKQYRHLVEE